MLTLQHIRYSHLGLPLLDDINFSLIQGNIVGLVGINGAGKSTTLKIVAGILRPDSGTILLEPSARIGYVPESPPLISSWTVRRFLAHSCELHCIPRSQRAKAIDRVSNLCDIHSIHNKACSALSKGNQQRVAIAQALLHSPNILILDEPTSGLDPQQIRQFRLLLQNLKHNTAIILSSHIMQEITMLCDHAIVINNGKQVGELNLNLHNQQTIVEFTKDVSTEIFSDFTNWQSKTGLQHQFLLTEAVTKNTILQFCLDKELSINRVIGIEDLAEREFLRLIGREKK